MNSVADIMPHAATRMAQRGIGNDDLELIRRIGPEVEGGYLVRDKDFQTLDRELKRLRDRVRRLVGKRLVIDGDRIVTIYHATRKKKRWLLRQARNDLPDD